MNAPYSIVGWAVAVNSAGSFLASPLFGAWADRRTTREVLAATLVLMIAGNVLYALSTNIWLLLSARFLVGVAAANYAVAQTYISYATTVDNRTKVMALNSAATVLGFIIGPAFALVTTFANFSVGGVAVTDYTAPGYLSALMSLAGIFSLVVLPEIPVSMRRKKGPSASAAASASRLGSGFYSGAGSVKDISQILSMKGRIPAVPVALSLWCYLTFTTSFTVFETIGTAYTQNAYDWDVLNNSLFFMSLGFLCVLSLVLLQLLVRCFNDRVLVVLCTSFAVVGFGLGITLHGSEYVPLYRFLIGCSLCSISYATSVAVLMAIYSKLLENLDQGMLMGWLSSSGSVARIIGPVVASYVLQYGGPRMVMVMMTALMASTLLLLTASYRLLTPRSTSKSINEANAGQ